MPSGGWPYGSTATDCRPIQDCGYGRRRSTRSCRRALPGPGGLDCADLPDLASPRSGSARTRPRRRRQRGSASPRAGASTGASTASPPSSILTAATAAPASPQHIADACADAWNVPSGRQAAERLQQLANQLVLAPGLFTRRGPPAATSPRSAVCTRSTNTICRPRLPSPAASLSDPTARCGRPWRSARWPASKAPGKQIDGMSTEADPRGGALLRHRRRFWQESAWPFLPGKRRQPQIIL